eukprot:12301718-Alexandrium_andersonii.AAC.1
MDAGAWLTALGRRLPPHHVLLGNRLVRRLVVGDAEQVLRIHRNGFRRSASGLKLIRGLEPLLRAAVALWRVG